MDFKTLKKNSGKNISKLVTELEKTNKGSGRFIDDRFWTIPTDEKTGNGTALFRFLPACGTTELPWIPIYTHAFQGPGGWYIENSLTTIGLPDPVSENNSELWSTGVDANKDIVRKRKRKQQFISNILVLSDNKNPQNEGKVFLFKYGKKIFDKISALMKPEFDGDPEVDPFDFWKGANFKAKVKKVDGYPNYDSSFFESPSALLGGDDVDLEKIYKAQYDLAEFVDPKNFKSYEELKARFQKVIGNVPPAAPKSETKAAPKPKPAPKPVVEDEEEVPWNGGSQSPSKETEEGDNEDLSDFLRKLADDD